MKGQAGFGGFLAGGDVDVVEDLQVVGEELDGHDQHGGVPGGPEAGEEVLEVGLEPFLGAVAGRLVGELPASRVQAGPLDHGVDRLGDLVQVAGVAVDHRLGQAVGTEQHRHVVVEPAEGLGDPLGQGVEEGRGAVPRPGQDDLGVGPQPPGGRVQGPPVAAHDHR